MRDNVTFVHPAPFVGVSADDESVLSVAGARWFADILARVRGLAVQPELCQEDWGVVLFASRDETQFWIGLSPWPELEQGWLAHLHHGSFSWLQRLRRSGQAELERLAIDLHATLSADPAVSSITWYREREMRRADPSGAPTPSE